MLGQLRVIIFPALGLGLRFAILGAMFRRTARWLLLGVQRVGSGALVLDIL